MFTSEICKKSKNRNCNRIKKVISFIGRLDPFKDPLTFIKSIPQVLKKRKDVKFVIVGFGVLETECKDLIKKLNIGQHVIMT